MSTATLSTFKPAIVFGGDILKVFEQIEEPQPFPPEHWEFTIADDSSTFDQAVEAIKIWSDINPDEYFVPSALYTQSLLIDNVPTSDIAVMIYNMLLIDSNVKGVEAA